MQLLLHWHEAEAKDYIDVLPLTLFANEGTALEVTHTVRGPKGGQYRAKCNVVSSGNRVDLDYRPFKGNSKYLPLGVTRLEFPSSDRTGEPTISWLDLGGTHFEPVLVTPKYQMATEPKNPVPIYDQEGQPVHAHFSFEQTDGRVLVTLESRGGKIGSANERNKGYAAGLKLLLERLGALKFTLKEALLASRATGSSSISDRQVKPAGYGLPMQLNGHIDAAHLAKALQRALGGVASARKTGGGNPTRRLQLVLVPATPSNCDNLPVWLAYGVNQSPVTDEELGAAAEHTEFDPADLKDARKKIHRAIAVRQGQGKFRNALRTAYGNACAITGCQVAEVLEAAHIVPYQGPDTNHVQNGLLLRADIHTLFDLGWIGIDPSTWRVVLHGTLRDGPYAALHGYPVRLPLLPTLRPSEAALRIHLQEFGLDG